MRCGGWIVTVLSVVALVSAERWGRIEPRYTLRKPYSDYIQNWRTSSAVHVEANKLRLTPQADSAHAMIWSQQPVGMAAWEVILEFGVHGAAPLSTGEGLAFWHAADPVKDGLVYGHTDEFKGLGVFFDSYDGDGDGMAEPYVLAMYNDGTQPIEADGAGKQLGVCFVDYRNLPYPARAKIAFAPDEGNHLSIGLDIDNSGKFKSCMTVKDENLKLDSDTQHFGLTVADYGNDFEVFSLLGINTSQEFHPSKVEQESPDVIEVVDEGLGDHPDVFEHHGHFARITNKMADIQNRLSALDDQFEKQFAASFQNHNKVLEFHITKVQNELKSRNEEVEGKISQVFTKTEDMQRTLNDLQLLIESGGGGAKSTVDQEKAVQDLTAIKVSCATDNHRGSVMVSGLKDTVENLKRRQEEILVDVHTQLNQMSDVTVGGCGGSSVLSTVCLVVGVLGGVWLMKLFSPDKRSHLL